MDLLHKKCEVCGTKINKLQKILNIYALKTGEKLKCQNCGTLYKTNKLISFFGELYTSGGVFLFAWLAVTVFIDSFGFKLGWEAWLYSFIILGLINFIIMLITPLEKIEKEEKDN